MGAQRGHDLPVSAFKGREDGVGDGNLLREKGVAAFVRFWIRNCIQCNPVRVRLSTRPFARSAR